MKRRDVLKGISLGFGYSIASSTLLTFLSSCHKNGDWMPQFINSNQRFLLNKILDKIIPNSEEKSTTDLILTRFTDKMIFNTNTKEEKNHFNIGSNMFIEKFELLNNKKIKEGSKKEFEVIIGSFFNITSHKKSHIFDLMDQKYESIPTDKKNIYSIYKFLTMSRAHSLLGYYTTQYAQQELLGYHSVPGNYIGCPDL